MNVRNFSLVLAIAVMSVSSVSAQSDFFFSFAQGGTNGDQSADLAVGDTGSLWVYWSTNGPADSDLSVGAFIDVMSSTAGVIQFDAAETFDYDLLVGGNPSGLQRLGSGGSFGPTAPDGADFINEMAAFTVTGAGILEANNGSGVFTDSGYDANNDAFEWGRIDFTVIGEGSTSVSGAAGDGMIVNGPDVVDAAFSTATINVAGGPIVPEPTTAGLLALGLVGFVARRRR